MMDIFGIFLKAIVDIYLAVAWKMFVIVITTAVMIRMTMKYIV